MDNPEPWLRGPLLGVPPLVMPVLHSFMQVREDLHKYAAGLSDAEVWCDVNGVSLGFHLKHIAGSVERLTAYLMGAQLTADQLAAAKRESLGDEGSDALIEVIEQALATAEKQLRAIDPKTLYDPRSVGRKALPTNVIGLLVHLAEHTQRHLGQVITLAKIVRHSA
jgi:uncharacterized damage-inducible protein DinB